MLTLHNNVANEGIGNPVTPLIGFVEVVTVAVPLVTVHTPLPTVGTLAESVATVTWQSVWSEPALAVGVASI